MPLREPADWARSSNRAALPSRRPGGRRKSQAPRHRTHAAEKAEKIPTAGRGESPHPFAPAQSRGPMGACSLNQPPGGPAGAGNPALVVGACRILSTPQPSEHRDEAHTARGSHPQQPRPRRLPYAEPGGSTESCAPLARQLGPGTRPAADAILQRV
ncbi:hypothetical protein NDU88_008292 [Pleurodeles waltl]|uniref:Uncharacterized protein n=1 Tax=Pleurodeles waltl TaxID=8319 RepID=A0AAV7PRP6_PLEWA|nr:hypothetical protein NDU88_008292 [Pleurodeles waltl]